MNGLTIKKLETYQDARGWNTHPLNESALRDGWFANIHTVSMNPGAIRGNHRHAKQTEEVMIIGGPVLFVARDAETGESFERGFSPDEQLLITLSPGVAHAFKNTGGGVAYLLCATNLAYDPANPDTVRVELIKPES